MDRPFLDLIDGFASKLEKLLEMAPYAYGELPKTMPSSGVYLFTEGGTHLYVGRSNKLRDRYWRHCRPGATDRQAAFAFQLAREATGRVLRSYKPGDDSRAGLMRDLKFATAFIDAKARIRKMQYRYVEESDQRTQAILEFYCAIVLDTRYNSFTTS